MKTLLKLTLVALTLALVSCDGAYSYSTPTYQRTRVDVYDRYGWPYYNNRSTFSRRYYSDHRRYCPPVRPVRVVPRSYQRNDCR